MTKKKAPEDLQKVGRKTKYNKEIAERLAVELTTKSIKEGCKTVGIDETTYYEWLYKYPEFSQLSTLSRKTKAVHHFNKCEDILDEVQAQRGNEDYRSDLARLRLDFHLRLAGKANQGLFGDKIQTEDLTKQEPVKMVVNLSKE